MRSTSKSRTVNRGWIKRMIEKGKIMIKTDMILTDDYVYDSASNCQKSGWKKADIKDFGEMDFSYKSGHAHWNEDHTLISWTMLTNHYYTLKVID